MKRWELLLGIMLALIRRLLENLGGYQKKEGALGRKFLVKVPFSFERLSLNKDLKVRYAVMPEGKKYWGGHYYVIGGDNLPSPGSGLWHH